MKIRTVVIALVAVVISVRFAAPAGAQPRPLPPGDRPGEHRPGERPDEHRPGEHPDEHSLRPEDRHDEHRDAVIAHRETEEQVRIRLLRQQDEEHLRRQAERKDLRAWEARRDQRALEARNELQSTWGPALDRPEARTELAIHADRIARLNRILDVAEDKADAALIARTRAVIQREIARDARVLHAIRVQVEGQ